MSSLFTCTSTSRKLPPPTSMFTRYTYSRLPFTLVISLLNLALNPKLPCVLLVLLVESDAM